MIVYRVYWENGIPYVDTVIRPKGRPARWPRREAHALSGKSLDEAIRNAWDYIVGGCHYKNLARPSTRYALNQLHRLRQRAASHHLCERKD